MATTKKLPAPPKTYTAFIKRFPQLADAWEHIAGAGQAGPLSEREQRLVKLAVAMGAMREGSVHSGVRKALALGISLEEIEQVVSLAAGTMGLPATVALWTWCKDTADKK